MPFRTCEQIHKSRLHSKFSWISTSHSKKALDQYFRNHAKSFLDARQDAAAQVGLRKLGSFWVVGLKVLLLITLLACMEGSVGRTDACAKS